MADTDDSQQLLNRITERRRGVEAYLRRARPRSDRLTMVTIISSAIAAVLTRPRHWRRRLCELNIIGSGTWRTSKGLATFVSARHDIFRRCGRIRQFG
jgi:hypothetical protein